MKAILIEIDGIINKASSSSDGALVAARQALADHGVEVAEDALAEVVTQMSAAHADDPFVSAMWHFFRPVVAGRGYDRKHQLRAWRELQRARRSHLPFRFRERAGVRALLEELRFGCVDSWGDVPKLVAVGRDGEFAKNALEVDLLTPLFEAVLPCEDFGMSRADPRYLERVLERVDLPASKALFVGHTLRPLAVTAATIGIETLVLLEGSAALGYEAARLPEEEPTWVVSSFDALCEGVVEWTNAPSISL